MAMYNNEDKAYSSIRISIGTHTTREEIDVFSNIFSEKVETIKALI